MRNLTLVISLAVVVAISIFHSQPTRAGLMLEFDSTSYAAAPGGFVDVVVLLRATGADTTYLDTGGFDGLFSLGVRINHDNLGTGASVLSIGDIAIDGTHFDDLAAGNVFRDVGAGFARVIGFSNDIDEGVQTGVGDPLTVRLATFRFKLSGTPGAITNLSFADYDVTTDDSVDVNFNVLDSQIDYSGTAMIQAQTAAVPEPSSVALCSVMGICALMRRRWMIRSLTKSVNL